jgi:hypothetical protein
MTILSQENYVANFVIYGLRLDQPNSLYRYVGLTTNGATNRLREHLRWYYSSESSPLISWIHKYSNVGFIIEVIDYCADDDYNRPRSEAHARGAHTIWHVNKNITNPKCSYCTSE